MAMQAALLPNRSDPNHNTPDYDKSTRAERFLAAIPASLRADFLDVIELWSLSRDSAGSVLDDFLTRLSRELRRPGADWPCLTPSRRADLRALQRLLKARRHDALLLVASLKREV